MKQKIHYIAFTAAFMIILLLPLAFVDYSGGAISAEENRYLAARPAMSYAFEHPRDFIRMFDEWYSDNIGFRGQLVRLYNSVISDTQVRETRGNLVYLHGEDGHEFYAGSADGLLDLIPKFQGRPFLTDNELALLTDGICKIDDYLSQRDISLVVMFCTDKETVYPEYYPRSIGRGPEPVQLDIITESIQNGLREREHCI